ncbi:succinate dehydrogenase/fumarate reductase cytochrome b subunit [Arcobacter sp. CECT 8986]|uniref:fumarate reductase cytochrome b subunit n=1 Tax=Arcobacter sp. CECT 8986 TaxID=2044507 RepID=UPI001009C4A0|nr:fumarate reductase cytochrome b subunit [Arcobacter sp. CECT 8986]RXJ98616.1 succinate dehydrogenase/fumarate reductase cytochrome b subunit [Arcobacter sp. CECT 8986]
MENVIEAFTGVTPQGKKSRTPAKLDVMLTASGVILALFMMGHMLFVSTILLGKDVMYTVTKMFELEFLFEGGIPAVVSVIVLAITVIFIVHAILGARKFPTSYRAYIRIREHSKMMHHKDTSMWMFQWISGLIMMFAGLVHLFIMFTQPQNIGPFASAYRVVENHMWLLYVVLLICVEIHGSVGLYRAAMKWGWFDGENPKQTRANLIKVKKILSYVFMTLGVVSLAAYIKIGLDHNIAPGEKYQPNTNTIEILKD